MTSGQDHRVTGGSRGLGLGSSSRGRPRAKVTVVARDPAALGAVSKDSALA